MKLSYKKIAFVSLAAASLFTASCKKDFLETRPSDRISVDDMTSSTTGLMTMLEGMHTLFCAPGASMSGRAFDWGQKSIDQGLDVMGEDIVCAQSGYDWFTYHYQYVSTEAANYWMPAHYWRFYYRMINNANLILENIDAAKGDQTEKNNIKGQALAYRAYSYFKLVNGFSKHYLEPGGPSSPGVPIYLVSTKGDTQGKPRGTVQDVYDRAFEDIQESITLLGGVNRRTNLSHIDQAVANGIYARIALTSGRYAEAYAAADAAANSVTLMNTNQLLGGFGVSNEEWLWSSNLTSEQYNGRSLNCFIGWMDDKTAGYANAGVYRNMAETLFKMIPDSDVRKRQFLATSFFKQAKFYAIDPSGFEYKDLYMRGAEMHLIRIEALARQGRTQEAKDMLETFVRTRDENYSVDANIARISPNVRDNRPYKRLLGKTDDMEWTVLDEIKIQRKVELWGEGFSYDDIRRYQMGLNRPRNFVYDHSPSAAVVISLPANDPKFIFPIPQEERDNNPNMGQ